MELENDLAFLREAVPDLQNYLLSREIYWPLGGNVRISGGAHLPQLSIGNLAFAQARLSALKMADGQQSELSRLTEQIQVVRSEWLSNWRLKAGREFNARLHLWQHFMDDLREDRGQHSPFIGREIRNRVLLQLLSENEAEVSTSDEKLLEVLDQILRGMTRPGPFAWETEISAGFPPDRFWFLYVALQTTK
jgi:hypothetical protein